MFHELLDNPNRIEPGPLQAAARKNFPDVVKRSHLELIKTGQYPSNIGKYVLIGVAVYSPKELQLLDSVDVSYPNWRGNATVAVFDLTECKNKSDVLMYYFPTPTHQSNPCSLEFVPQSPIVGIWDGAVLLDLKTGLYNTQELLRNEQILK